ncbi:MAG TPA: hypothetical protein VGI81_17360 [Tepidisphaeraceae bacterium]|jgi:hypothetical protein
MAARKRSSSPPRRGNPAVSRADGGRPKAPAGQTSGEAGADSLREEAERNWAASDRRAARKRRRKDAKPKQ